MTEPTDIDALIAEVRRREFQKPNTGGELRGMYLMDLASSLADALESTAAELRQVEHPDACSHENFTSLHIGRGMVRMTCHDCGETVKALSTTAQADIDERSTR